jgi:predicted KAP-like P-loop ATPase
MSFKLPKFDPINNSSQDKFDFNNGAKRLANILDNVELPNCFGIYGIWGSGKTSLMNLTKRVFETDENYKNKIATVWFNPWEFEYESEVPILFPLLKSIQSNLNSEEELKEFFKKSFKHIAAKTMTVASIIGQMGTQTDLKNIKENLEIANKS